MLPRNARRLSTSAPRLSEIPWDSKPPPAPVSNKELVRQTRRRMMKAERDERIDISMALTPVKTYEGGFTKPRDLRSGNWFRGGRYLAEKKTKYETPSPAAYEPHTVFLLESRYMINHGIGRTDAYEHVVGVCREGDLPAVLEKFNSASCPEGMESMDNARWPFLKPKKVKRVQWWGRDENPKQIIQKALEGEIDGEIALKDAAKRAVLVEQPSVKPSSVKPPSVEPPSVEPPLVEPRRGTRRSRGGSLGLSPARFLPSPSESSMTQSRTLHYSFVRLNKAPADNDSTSPSQRVNIPTSSWARPPKASQDAHDDVVPAYYIERKRQRSTISERKEEEGSLMAELSAGILSEGVAAQTRTREEKIPVEVKEIDGTVRHPSGFEPPTPETEFHPVASKTATIDNHPLLTTIKVPWDEALSPSVVEASPGASTTSASSSTKGGVRGFHTSAIVCATVGLDLPPHLAPAPSSSTAAESSPKDTSSADAALAKRLNAKAIRSQYLPTLAETPFWRPLITITLATRPLALAIARLSRGLERGLAFYAAIDPDDRKPVASFSSRLRSLRIKRMQSLTNQITEALQGYRGGLVGLRLSDQDKGRGIDGDALDDSLAKEGKVVKIGVGEWYPLADEVKEAFIMDAKESQVNDQIHVFGLTERGCRTDGVEWSTPTTLLPFDSEKLEANGEAKSVTGLLRELDGMVKHRKWLKENSGTTQAFVEIRERIEKFCKEHERELANEMALRHASVIYPYDGLHNNLK